MWRGLGTRREKEASGRERMGASQWVGLCGLKDLVFFQFFTYPYLILGLMSIVFLPTGHTAIERHPRKNKEINTESHEITFKKASLCETVKQSEV